MAIELGSALSPGKYAVRQLAGRIGCLQPKFVAAAGEISGKTACELRKFQVPKSMTAIGRICGEAARKLYRFCLPVFVVVIEKISSAAACELHPIVSPRVVAATSLLCSKAASKSRHFRLSQFMADISKYIGKSTCQTSHKYEYISVNRTLPPMTDETGRQGAQHARLRVLTTLTAPTMSKYQIWTGENVGSTMTPGITNPSSPCEPHMTKTFRVNGGVEEK